MSPDKEWKPKSTNPSVSQNASTAASYEVSSVSVGSQPESQQTPSEKAMPELQKKLEELLSSNTQQVVLPNHIQVPEAGKLGFCFGSFDASFGLEMIQDGSLRSGKITPLSESSDPISEPVKVPQLRCLFCPLKLQFCFQFFFGGGALNIAIDYEEYGCTSEKWSNLLMFCLAGSHVHENFAFIFGPK